MGAWNCGTEGWLVGCPGEPDAEPPVLPPDDPDDPDDPPPDFCPQDGQAVSSRISNPAARLARRSWLMDRLTRRGQLLWQAYAREGQEDTEDCRSEAKAVLRWLAAGAQAAALE